MQMQEQIYSFEGLREILLEKLKGRGFSAITITGYRYQCNSIFKWLNEKGYDHYTVEGGNCFLQN